jgi:radical SAM superfamily enzyme YgiQ (UPF0313 family)
MYKKILFIISSSNSIARAVLKKSNCTPNIGVLYIASVLKMHGYEVKIIDMLVEDFTAKGFIEEIKLFNPDIIGMSIFTEAYDNAIEIIKMIKKNFIDIKIAVGGPHATFEGVNMMREIEEIDYVIRYEGEFTFLLLLEHLNYPDSIGIEKVKSLIYRKRSDIVCNEKRGYIEALDVLPFPVLGMVDRDKYSEIFALITSRGCPGDCVYCSSKAMSGGKYRYRSAENIISEVYYIYNKTKENLFEIYDDTFTVNKSRVKKFCKLLKEVNIPVIWRCQSRADVLTEELIHNLYDADCKYIHIGIESGNQIVLDKIGKKIKLKEALDKVIYAKDLGINIYCSFIIGHYCDTIETIEETLETIRDLKNKGISIGVASCTPYPGTFIKENAEEIGLNIHAKRWREYQFGNPIVSNKDLSLDDLRDYLFKGFKEFFIGN